jgi:hypothetical protein
MSDLFSFDLPTETARYRRLRCGDGGIHWVQIEGECAKSNPVGALAFEGWVDIMALPTLEFLADSIVIDAIRVDPDIDTLGYFITAWLEPKETP